MRLVLEKELSATELMSLLLNESHVGVKTSNTSDFGWENVCKWVQDTRQYDSYLLVFCLQESLVQVEKYWLTLS